MKILKISRSAAKNNLDANTLMHGLWRSREQHAGHERSSVWSGTEETCLLLFSRTSDPVIQSWHIWPQRTLETWYLPKHWHLTSFMYWQNTCKCTFSTSKCIVIECPYVIFRLLRRKISPWPKQSLKHLKKNQKVLLNLANLFDFW